MPFQDWERTDSYHPHTVQSSRLSEEEFKHLNVLLRLAGYNLCDFHSAGPLDRCLTVLGVPVGGKTARCLQPSYGYVLDKERKRISHPCKKHYFERYQTWERL